MANQFIISIPKRLKLAIGMSQPTIKISTSELVAARLFSNEQSKLNAWIERTRTRTEQSLDTGLPNPLNLPSKLSPNIDKTILMELCKRVEQTGFAVYQWTDQPIDVANSASALLYALSLRDSDQGVMREAGELSLLQDFSGTPKGRFPPYQSKAMNWHTDGYYNDPADAIRCFTLHCVAPATDGGALLLMDDAYLVYALWQENPELVLLLSHPEAMTLPHNKDNEGHDRPDRCVPVILQNADETLSMRFTTRTQHIKWRCNATQAAALRASELINSHSQWHTRITLQQSQGVVTRNVLHAREQFVDAPGKPKRQMLRGRFTQLPKPAEPSQTCAEN